MLELAKRNTNAVCLLMVASVLQLKDPQESFARETE